MERIPKLDALGADKIGKDVKLHGWVYSVRVGGAGSLCFVDLGDGTGDGSFRTVGGAASFFL